MKIHIDRIPLGGLHLVETRPAEWLNNYPELARGEGDSSAGPIQLDLTIERFGSQVNVKGTITMTVSSSCSRCLEPTKDEIEAPVNVFLAPEKPGDIEDDEEEGYETYSGEELDLAEHLRGQIVLHYPIRFLCRADCKGLCPTCGVNLNNETCSCAVKKFNSRWDKLKDLKF